MTEVGWLASADPAAMLELLRAVRSGQQIVKAPHTVSDRKLRLFACACCRSVWHLLTDERSRRAVEVAERYADGLATEDELYAASQEATYAARGEENTPLFAPAWVADQERFLLATERIRSQNGSQFDKKAGATQAALLREVVGSPFRPVTPLWHTIKGGRRYSDSGQTYLGEDPDVSVPVSPWLTPTVLALARAAYGYGKCPRCLGAKRTWEIMPVTGQRLLGPCPDCRGTGEALGPFDAEVLPVLADALEDAGCTDAELLNHLRDIVPCPGCSHGQTEWYGGGGGWCAYCDQSGPDINHIPASRLILAHRHLHGPHARGCWALDLLLGKE